MKEDNYILFPTAPVRSSESSQKGPPESLITPLISNNFEAKKKAAKINSYFVNSKYFVQKVVLSLFFVIVVVAVANISKSTLRRISTKLIDERTTKILDSLSTEASVKVNQIINKSVFFSNLFSEILSNPPLIDLTQDSASDVILMLDASKNSTGDSVFFWDLGCENGNYFSMANILNETKRVIGYGKSYKSNMTGYVDHWYLDEDSIPYGFPYYDSVFTTEYCFLNQSWYNQVNLLNKSSWIGPYIDTLDQIQTLFFSYSAPFYYNGIFNGTTSHSVPIQAFHGILSMLNPSDNSRLALLDNYGYLLASNSLENVIQVFNNTIYYNTLNSLQDPIWNCIIDGNNKVSDSQPLFNCRHNGNDLSILIISQPVYIGASFLWNLVGAICLNDFSIGFRTSANKTSQITNILILFTFVISGVFIILRYTVLCHFQRNFSDIDSNEENNLLEFENILKISNKRSVVDEIHAISYDLLRSFQTLFYQSPNILLSIHDMTLREHLTTKFSIPQVYETSSLSFRRFDIKDKTLFRGGQVAFNRIGRNIVENDHMSSVVNLFVEINSQLLFSNKLLKELLNTIFFKFTLSDLKLVSDSFNLIGYLLTNGLPAVYTDCDLSISILIATLLYHILMIKRFERKKLEEIYLLENDDEIYVEAENLMENFKNIRLERVEYDFKRWNRICDTITSFLPALFLRDQLSLPKMFKNVTKFRSGVLYRNEELMYCSILIIVAQYSYFFHTPENFEKFRIILHRNTSFLDDEMESFESVLKNEIIADCVASLEAVIDPDVFLGLVPQ